MSLSRHIQGRQVLDFPIKISVYKSVFDSINSRTEMGTEALLEGIFNEIGFNQITDTLFKYLVYSRLSQLVRKLKTTEYLFLYKGIGIT